MESCLYEGYLQHRRLSPAEHVFRYSLYLVYLDLDELPAVMGGGYGLHRAAFSPASFLRRDHVGDAGVPLADAVRNLAEERTGWRPTGPIRLLTLLRNWGHYERPPFAGIRDFALMANDLRRSAQERPFFGIEKFGIEIKPARQAHVIERVGSGLNALDVRRHGSHLPRPSRRGNHGTVPPVPRCSMQ